MKTLKSIVAIATVTLGSFTLYAQPAPPPPAPESSPMVAPGPAPVPVPTPGPAQWGSPWWNGWNAGATMQSPSVSTPDFNNGTMNVVACGYDAQGVWRVLPLNVKYNYNGVNYDVTVLNAWDPWTDQWNTGVDVQAFITDYTLRGVNYNYYVVLSFGTFYFNL